MPNYRPSTAAWIAACSALLYLLETLVPSPDQACQEAVIQL